METTEIMKEKDIRKMITAYMIDELQKHDDYVLTNISYGNDFSESVTAVNVDDNRKRLTIGLKHRKDEMDTFDYVMELDGEETYYSTIYRINSDTYTTCEDKYLESERKRFERYKRHSRDFNYYVREIRIRPKFYKKYMDIVKEVEMNTRGRKIKDCDISLIKQGNDILAIHYKHRGREYNIVKYIGLSQPWKIY